MLISVFKVLGGGVGNFFMPHGVDAFLSSGGNGGGGIFALTDCYSFSKGGVGKSRMLHGVNRPLETCFSLRGCGGWTFGSQSFLVGNEDCILSSAPRIFRAVSAVVRSLGSGLRRP